MSLTTESWHHLITRVAPAGLEQAGLAILVATRLAAAFFIGRCFGQALLTWRVRLGLVLFLTAIVSPQLSGQASSFPLIQLTSSIDLTSDVSAPAQNSRVTDPKATPAAYLIAILRNALIGASLGLGVTVFVMGTRLAGEWFDRHSGLGQSGLGLGNLLNPEQSDSGSAMGELAALLTIATLLVLEPFNGHLLVVRLILESFHSIPVPVAEVPDSVMELPGLIAQQSLILGLRIAMPFVVAMSLLELTLGFTQRSSRWQLAPTAVAVRAIASLLILTATFPGIHEAAVSTFQDALQIGNQAVFIDESR